MFTRGEKSSNSRGTRRISRLTLHLEQNRRGHGATICHRTGQYWQHLFYELSSTGTLVLHFASIVTGKYPILIVHLCRHWLHSRLSKHTSVAEKNLDTTRTRSPWHYARRLSVCNERPDLSCYCTASTAMGLTWIPSQLDISTDGNSPTTNFKETCQNGQHSEGKSSSSSNQSTAGKGKAKHIHRISTDRN